jgi:transcriptional regulator with XRE-family HTH domain
LSVEEEKEAELVMERIKLGNELAKRRKSKKATLLDIGNVMGVSANYISEIERGLKVPSDKMIRQIADFYGYDEGDLFKKFGKIPLLTRETLEENPSINELIDEIGKRKDLSDDKKEEVIEELLKFTKRLLRNVDEG